AIADRPGDAGERLTAVLETYALISHRRRHHGAELSALVHRDDHLARAQQQLNDLLRDLLAAAVMAGDVRDDMPPDELTGYCRHALAAAGSLPSEAAVRRLVTLTMAGLRPPR